MEVHSVWSIGQPALDTSWVEHFSVRTTTQYILMHNCTEYIQVYVCMHSIRSESITNFVIMSNAMIEPLLGALIILILINVVLCCRLPLKQFCVTCVHDSFVVR